MNNIHIKLDGNDTIIIEDVLDGIVTITSKDLNSQSVEKNLIYKVFQDGKIIKVNDSNEIDNESLFNKVIEKTSKDVVIDELINNGFEQIPDTLTELELKNILEFSRINIDKSYNYSKMFPYSVEITDVGDLKVTLLMYNGIEDSISLSKFPFKLMDAKDEIVIADLIDIDKSINPLKIEICILLLKKERLSMQTPDLSEWTITFELH